MTKLTPELIRRRIEANLAWDAAQARSLAEKPDQPKRGWLQRVRSAFARRLKRDQR